MGAPDRRRWIYVAVDLHRPLASHRHLAANCHCAATCPSGFLPSWNRSMCRSTGFVSELFLTDASLARYIDRGMLSQLQIQQLHLCKCIANIPLSTFFFTTSDLKAEGRVSAPIAAVLIKARSAQVWLIGELLISITLVDAI